MSVRKFKTLTPGGKRARIARDVIAQVKAKKVIPANSGYLNLRGFGYSKNEDISIGGALGGEETTCQACAIGAMFCGLVGNDSTSNINGDTFFGATLRTKLAKFFDLETLSNIESVFEGSTDWVTSSMMQPTVDYLTLFDKYETPENRLLAMMSNIVKNRGNIKWEELI